MSNNVKFLRNRISWLPNSGFVSKDDIPSGTFCLTLGCSHDFRRVRVGIPNISNKSFIIDKLEVCISSSWGDYFNPKGGVGTTLYANGLSRIVVEANCDPLEGMRPLVPRWTWTDWVDLNNFPTEKNLMRVIMFRGFTEKRQTMTFSNGQFQEYRNNSKITSGFEYWIGGVNNGWDLTDFKYIDQNSLLVNNPCNGTPFSIVQFETDIPGIVGMSTGDSHHSGVSTVSQANSFLSQFITSFGNKMIGLIPVGLATDASGGLRSDEFFKKSEQILSEILPSFFILPGWTANDHTCTSEAADVIDARFLSRLNRMTQLIRQTGAVPIFLTPFPSNFEFWTDERLISWLNVRKEILDYQCDDIVIDASKILSLTKNGQLNGRYIEGLSSDEAHPNDAGHNLISKELLNKLYHRVRSDI